MSKDIEIPYDEDIEQVVLGTLMLESGLIHSWIQDLNVNLFYNKKHQEICNAILNLYKENVAIDILTVFNEIRKVDKHLTDASYISTLTNRISSTSHFDYHFRILQEFSLKRVLLTVFTNGIKDSYAIDKDVFEIFHNAQIDLENAIKKIVNYKIVSAGEVHKEIIEISTKLLDSNGKSGVPSGLTKVDNLTNGWQKSDLVILAGRPAMGKTAAAISMAMSPAIENNIPVLLFSLEMSASQVVSRMQSFLSGVNVGNIVKKKLTVDEISKISQLGQDLNEAPIYIDDTPNLSILDLKGKARKLVKEKGVKLILIDYLQLMRSGVKTNSRENEIAEISRGLKAIAKELDVPVIALSQLSRAVETRSSDKKPQLSDLRESGQIEQDADMVIFCYRPEYYQIEEYEVGGETFNTTGLFMFIVAKHRNGELGEIPLTFIHEQTKLVNYVNNPSPFEHNYINNRTFVQQMSNKGNVFDKSEDEDIPF